ncbi:MAG TPA: flagellar regulator YcgR PilZN domain-containing protein [Burkholderiales bacterium]|nr:flagellar regulator YcgR PilZN domain-containing protein [Burkholderiales bacterium]
MSDIATRLANTGQLLVRSGIEIDRILGAMVDDHATVTANLPGQVIFLSRLVQADPVKQRLLLAYSDYKAANTALLTSASVTFRCHHRWGQFAFNCNRPRPASHAGQPVIEMVSPTIMIGLQHRRRAVRPPAPLEPAELHCQLRMGLIAFDARLVDMSLDGRAFLLADPALPVCAGTRLEGVRIRPRGREALSVAIEVSHVIPTVLPNGERATRIGCRIVADDRAMEQLVGRFVVGFE